MHLLFFKSTCITVSTWQPRKDVNFRDPFFCEVDELEELEDPIDRLNERELEWDDVDISGSDLRFLVFEELLELENLLEVKKSADRESNDDDDLDGTRFSTTSQDPEASLSSLS